MEQSRTILVTGFPGFIAGRLVDRLAAEDARFYLLVQPAFVEAAMRSIETIALRSEVGLENFALVEGDITKPDLGIYGEDLTTIRGEVTDVFHLAAVYDLAVAKDLAEAVNVRGTENVNEFVRSLPNLRRYNYVSTCYVAGCRTGHILESELVHAAGFRNNYEETKYLAELSVEKMKGEMPLTIFRPSVVVGDSRTGETAKYDGIYYLIQYLRKSPKLLRLFNVGNKQVRVNLVPVDFVVEGIAVLSNDENAVGKTIALADPNPLATADIFNCITRELCGKDSAFILPASLTEKMLMLPISPPISGLPHSAVPYFFLPQTYDTSVADELLSKHRIGCPGFAEYVAKLLAFVDRHPKL
ncbi:MAG: SDR family oxidoreductase [bacterium]|nr:SDR family oxidoreductase [bacterium]